MDWSVFFCRWAAYTLICLGIALIGGLALGLNPIGDAVACVVLGMVCAAIALIIIVISELAKIRRR